MSDQDFTDDFDITSKINFNNKNKFRNIKRQLTLREQFEKETGAHPFADQKYIEWLEKFIKRSVKPIGRFANGM